MGGTPSSVRPPARQQHVLFGISALIGLRRGLSRRFDGEVSSGSRTTEDAEVSVIQWRLREAGRILRLAGPALSIPLADPVMTFIDTVCVSQGTNLVQLAALAPNTVIFNVLNYGTAFLGIATVATLTNLGPSSTISESSRRSRQKQQTSILADALGIAVCLGVIACAVMQFKAPVLLELVGAAPFSAFFSTALTYLRVRALSAPAMVTVIVAQSALLALREFRAPSVIVFAAAAVNVIGDVVLVSFCGLGALGAAWATVVAEYVCAACLLVALRRHLPLRVAMPSSPKSLAPFASIGGPVLIYKSSKNLCYGMIQARATSLGQTACAAHQVVWTLWTVLSFVPEPLSQAAQVLLPERLLRNDRVGQELLRESVMVLLSLGLVAGFVLSFVAGVVPRLLPQLLTRDRTLWPVLKSIATPAVWSTLLGSLSCCVEGTLLARREYSYMAGSMIVTFSVLAAILRRIEGSGPIGLVPVWWCLAFFFSRCASCLRCRR